MLESQLASKTNPIFDFAFDPKRLVIPETEEEAGISVSDLAEFQLNKGKGP